MDDPEETFGGDGDPSPAPYEELVSAMAGGLYSELERLVGAYGPGAVSGLLPQLVSVLESLQGACGQVRERDQALERLRDDRLRLLEQDERERTGRKRAEEVGISYIQPVLLPLLFLSICSAEHEKIQFFCATAPESSKDLWSVPNSVI